MCFESISITHTAITDQAGLSHINTGNFKQEEVQHELNQIITKDFDKEQALTELGAQVNITTEFDNERRAIRSEFAKKAEGYRKQAEELPQDSQERTKLEAKAKQIDDNLRLFDGITSALYAPNSNGIIGDVARAASPELAYQIGQYFKENKLKNEIDGGNRPEEQSANHLLAHAILGAAVSYATGNNITTGALSGASSEVAAPALANYLYGTNDPEALSQEQKDTIVSIITLGTASIAYGAMGDVSVAVNASEVGKGAVENNATFIDKKNEVKKVILNGDKGIYKCNFQNDKCIDNPIKIGETMFEDAFISPDTGNPVGRVYIGESIDEYIYRLNDKAWSAGFYAEELYAYNSLPGNIYDIKSSYPNHEGKSYHGFLFDGKYITLREGGNILAGMNAATLGIPYEEFQKASGALHAGGKLGLIRHKTTGYTYGTYPRYGEIDYQYLRSKYGYSLGLKRIECNLNNTNSLECKK